MKNDNEMLSKFIDGKFNSELNQWRFKTLLQPPGKNTPEFFSDWNWINLVIDKIESKGFLFITVGIQTKVVNKFDLVNSKLEDIKPIVQNGYGNDRIKSCYKTCVDFVNWYNTTVKSC